ncbi:hypothetical protein RFI_13860 [Reticulomyxa filosa]|uniref:RING-type domain-containing protein n=1 Tax=Reticulomyxa filosa TaxID=46433 RepID=X6NC07_RETFI|nr:hypothetical protein RFI_13860 [Reticulomyxa filosa]|eukprot:ETO23319.1 hypothetical protein RFI_13860 [Reticulomyxa filosa]
MNEFSHEWSCNYCNCPNFMTSEKCAICGQGEQPNKPGLASRSATTGAAKNKAMGNGGTWDETESDKKEANDWMAEYMCEVCKKEQGYETACGHKCCGGCVKKHLLNGIVSQRWKKEAIRCFVGQYQNEHSKKDCKEQLPEWLIRQSGLGELYQKQIEEMQKEFLISSDPSMTQCPQCKNYFVTETGEVEHTSKENRLDGKPIGMEEQKHKARWRFRCSECSTIFCGSCKTSPYHIGYTCETWKHYREAQKCRFCDKPLTADNTAKPESGSGPGLSSVCSDASCLEKRKWSCDRVHDKCGHNCIGIRCERRCLPCLDKSCVSANGNADSTTNSEEFCNICWVDPLKAGPTIRLDCGHHFHFMCVWNKVDRRWPSARITFGFLNCPLCKREIRHEAMRDIATKHFQLKEQITKDAVDRLKIEGLDNSPRLNDPKDAYFNNIEKFAMDRLAFYMCSKCNQPYFGGMKACEEAGMEQEEAYKQEHLVCGSCAAGSDTNTCKMHGKKYVTYNAKTGTYLNKLPIDTLPKCPGRASCPLGVEHPPNGKEEFSLGCVVCMRK